MRYFLNIRRQGVLLQDPDGTEASSLEGAREEAIIAAREILAVRLRRGEVIDGDAFEITDESGLVVEILPFRSVLKLD